MKPHAPYGWRIGDERNYSFSRSSGLPHDYFHESPTRRRWLVLALCFAAALLVL